MASPDKQTHKNRHFFQSLHHALAGLAVAVRREGNFRRETLATILVVALAWRLQVPRFDWLVLLLAILLVLLAELWNTVIEALVDLVVGSRYDEQAKRIKDMSAAAVLIAACIAVVGGVYVFGPYLWRWMNGIFG